MSVKVRIAPSPTGNLHIGTARTALFNWLYAKRQQGKFILRVEDTDQERSRPEFTENILSGLKWLGIDFDEGPFYQTQRLERYQTAVQMLLDQDLAYYCYCSEVELEQMREQQKAQKLAPRYDNRHRHLTKAERNAYRAEGRKPVIRFKIEEPREIAWFDLVRGEVQWNSKDLGGDLVIARVDDQGKIGLPLYNFAVVIDDIDMEITHVIRGEDHIANTAKQILLYEALGADMPEFGHLPLILNQQGAKISKRDGATSVDEFRAMGYLPQAFVNYMVLLGWSAPGGQELFTLGEAAEMFDFNRVNKAGAKFDWDKLNWVNSQYLHRLTAEQLLEYILPFWQGAGFDCSDRPWLLEIVDLIAASLVKLTDAIAIAEYFFVPIPTYTEAAQEILRSPEVKPILQSLQQALSTNPNLETLLKEVPKQLGVKKGAIMKPLRCALTGDVHGPDLLISLELLHQKQLALPRLAYAVALGGG
ncbi:MAG: glutamate--tRNA ligase [Pseudanabaenaceae cyanobacterium bins.68]|nr:glutamate--tRNA ligase [Pseudanabaenaceae cyanobacterium bins.68]